MTEDSFSPSFDPANRGNLAAVIRFVLTKFLQGTDDMLPAKVISYDRATNRAQVVPLLAIITTGNTQVQRAQIASVPVLQLGGGGFVISCPLKAGDLGWIKANDSDVSLFLKSLKASPPNTARLHSFEDAMFIPDTMFQNVHISDPDSMSIQNLDGSVKIALNDDIQMSGSVGMGGPPNAAAILDLTSTTKALVLPRMSTAQKTSISAIEGMYVYDTSLGRPSYYNGSVWS